MAFALIVETEAQSTDNRNVTTPAVDTTGANLIVLALMHEGSEIPTISDSKGNTWTARTEQFNVSATQLYDCVAPTVGSGHTFSVTYVSGSDPYPSLAVQAWSGAHASPFDVENGANQAGGDPTIQPGIGTPDEDNELFVTAVVTTGGGTVTNAIDASFIETADLDASATASGGAMAYKIQTTGGAENPTWTASGGPGPAIRAAVIAVYKAAAGVALPRGILQNQVRIRPAAFAPGIAR